MAETNRQILESIKTDVAVIKSRCEDRCGLVSKHETTLYGNGKVGLTTLVYGLCWIVGTTVTVGLCALRGWFASLFNGG